LTRKNKEKEKRKKERKRKDFNIDEVKWRALDLPCFPLSITHPCDGKKFRIGFTHLDNERA
jgi:hypothetical protein